MLFGRREEEDDTVVAMLAAAIRRDIAFGALVPDSKLKLDALRARYGGSNHSLRETLRMLSAEGLVEASSQRGFRVASATEADLADILMLRIEIESLGLRRSMERGGVAWEGAVLAAAHGLSRAETALAQGADDETALMWDEAARAFAAARIAACASPRLVETAARLHNQWRRAPLARLREGRLDLAEAAARREALLDAILGHDAPAACAVLRALLEAEADHAPGGAENLQARTRNRAI